MPQKIALQATSIKFTKHGIVYGVEFSGVLGFTKIIEGIVVSNNDIKDKDLILKSTYLDHNNLEVIFTPINTTPIFYQKIFEDLKSRVSRDHQLEKDDIYNVGDVVGYLVL